MKFYRVVSEDYLGLETHTTYEKFFIKKENAQKAFEQLFESEKQSKKQYGLEFEILENEENRKFIRDKWGNDTLISLDEIETED